MDKISVNIFSVVTYTGIRLQLKNGWPPASAEASSSQCHEQAIHHDNADGGRYFLNAFPCNACECMAASGRLAEDLPAAVLDLGLCLVCRLKKITTGAIVKAARSGTWASLCSDRLFVCSIAVLKVFGNAKRLTAGNVGQCFLGWRQTLTIVCRGIR